MYDDDDDDDGDDDGDEDDVTDHHTSSDAVYIEKIEPVVYEAVGVPLQIIIIIIFNRTLLINLYDDQD